MHTPSWASDRPTASRFGLHKLFRQTKRKTEGPQHFAFPEISRGNRGCLVLHSGNSRVSLSLRAGLGCPTKTKPGQPFDHKNGHGYVKAHRGFYHDAIFVKRNNFNLLLHETFGGGFSPTAVLKLSLIHI